MRGEGRVGATSQASGILLAMPVEEPPDLDWIETSDHPVAREAYDVLGEVLAQMDLMRVPQVISPYPRDTDDLKLDFDYHDRMAAARWQVVEMLRTRRILRSATFVTERSEYGPGEPIEMRTEADEKVARSARKLLADRLYPSAAPAPAPTPASAVPSNLGQLFMEEGAKAAGSTGGKWAMRVIIGLLTLAGLGVALLIRMFATPAHR
jgi:hypothetical protein